MFTDRIKVKLIAGKGGNGVVSWRREKYIPKGGPHGGNGGRGGSVILTADPSFFSLEAYRHKKILVAEGGQAGGSALKQGRSGKDLFIKVPYGTLVKDPETGTILFDFTSENPTWVACTGGKGGKGNAHFRSPTHQAPNICTPGLPGEEKELELELKLIADVGFVGMPNAGKSTLMSKITHARVKIGAYPFTTLYPNLGFLKTKHQTKILVADIPGIIENAHLDRGLGLNFLKHIERTSALVFIIDISGFEERDPCHDFSVLENELRCYDQALLDKPKLIILNKIDIEGAEAHISSFRKTYPSLLSDTIEISATEEQGLDLLIHRLEGLFSQRSPHVLSEIAETKDDPAEQHTTTS